MLSSFSTFQSLMKHSVGSATAVVSLTSFTGTAAALNTNPSGYTATGYNVFQIINNTSLPTTSTSGTNATGTFTLTVSGSTATIYLIVIGAGGSGGSGDQGGGGGSSGEFKYQKVSLPVGSYNVSFTVGAGNGGSDWVGSNSAYVDGANGYGRKGNNSSLVLNSVTYNAVGGSSGGPAYYSNSANGVGAYGGGGGASIASTATNTGSTGTILGKGGDSVGNGNIAGGAGGNSPMNAPSNGATILQSPTGYNCVLGGLGSAPIASNNSTLANTPYSLFPSVQYWCEGGSGSCAYKSAGSGGLNINGVISSYGLSGRSSGCFRDITTPASNSTVFASQPVNHTGSGGSGSFQGCGLSGTSIAPSGSNGVILIAF